MSDLRAEIEREVVDLTCNPAATFSERVAMRSRLVNLVLEHRAKEIGEVADECESAAQLAREGKQRRTESECRFYANRFYERAHELRAMKTEVRNGR